MILEYPSSQICLGSTFAAHIMPRKRPCELATSINYDGVPVSGGKSHVSGIDHAYPYPRSPRRLLILIQHISKEVFYCVF